MYEVELYARGLAMAEGSINRKAIRFHMGVDALPVLKLIAQRFGGKAVTRKNGRFTSSSLYVPEKACWKEGYTPQTEFSRHMMRGYVEGDGCVTRHSTSCDLKGGRKKYYYPAVKILVNPDEMWIYQWVELWLKHNVFKYCVVLEKPRKPRKPRYVFNIRGAQAERLLDFLYRGSNIHFKKHRIKGAMKK